MNPQQQAQVKNPLQAMAAGEQIIFEVKRHPFGLIGFYATFGILLVIVIAAVFVAPSLLTGVDSGMVRKVCLSALAVSIALTVIFGYVAHIVYYGNRWILTSDSLTQIKQNSLFDKQNSQLSLANLEDISAHQDGIMCHVFNFGLLKVETAGEHSKFSFGYCPNPNFYAQKILMAREAFEQGEHYRSATPTEPVGTNVNT